MLFVRPSSATIDWRRNLYVLVVAQFLSSLGFSFVSPFFPLYIQQLGVPDASLAAFWAGVAQFVSGMGGFLSGPIWGALADRYGRRPMVLRAGFTGAVILAVTGLAPNVGFIVLMRGLSGFFTGVITASLALAAAQAPRERVSFVVGTLQMAFFLGISTGPLLGGILADAVGYRIPFFVTGGLLLVGALLVLIFVRERFEPPKDQKSRSGPIQDVRMVLGMSAIVPMLVLLLLVRFGPQMLQPTLAAFMQTLVTDGAASVAGTAFSLLGFVSAGASVFTGRLTRKEDLRLVTILSCFAAAVCYVPQLWVHSPALSTALVALTGIPIGVLMTSTAALISTTVAQEHQGAVFGVLQSVTALAFGLGSLLGGTLGATLGLRSVFLADAALFAALGAGVWMMRGPLRAAAAIPEEAAAPKSTPNSLGGS